MERCNSTNLDELLNEFLENDILNNNPYCENQILRSIERINSESKLNTSGISEETIINYNYNYYQQLNSRNKHHNPYIKKNDSNSNILRETGQMIINQNCNKQYEYYTPAKKDKQMTINQNDNKQYGYYASKMKDRQMIYNNNQNKNNIKYNKVSFIYNNIVNTNRRRINKRYCENN